MTDLSSLSDADLQSLYQRQSQPRGLRNNNPLNLEATVKWTGMNGSDGRFATFDTMDDGIAAADRNLQTYATKHGLNTVDGIVGRWAPQGENNTRAYAQKVAADLGVHPGMPLDMNDPNVRQSLIGAMAKVENGQPLPQGAPDLASMSDAQLKALYGQVAPKPKAPPVAVKRPAQVAQASPTFAQDAKSGFAEPFVRFGQGVLSDYRRTKANAMAPAPSLMEAGKQALQNLTGGVRMAGDVLGMTTAPAQALIRPGVRALNKANPLTAYTQDNAFSQPRAMTPQEEQAKVEGAVNTALSAAMPAKARAGIPVAAKPKAMTLDELKTASDAAWAKVDASGFKFPQKDVKATAATINKLVADEGGKDLYPQASALAKRIDSLAGSGDLSVAQLNRLKSQVGEKLMQPGSTEAHVGRPMLDALENLIQSSNDPALGEARTLYTRLKKVQEVTNRIESADLTAASTYSGGNKNNAMRQKLRPLADPKSPQRMRNLTPDEKKALSTAIRGTPGQNAIRLAGKALDPRGLIGSIVQTTMGVGSHGLSTASIPLGIAATEAGNAMTGKNIQNLVDLMSAGGTRGRPVPALPPAPANSLALHGLGLGGPYPSDLIGAGVVAAPLARRPSGSKTKAKSRKGR